MAGQTTAENEDFRKVTVKRQWNLRLKSGKEGNNRRRAVRLTVEIGNSGKITVEGQENLRLRLEKVGK